MEGRRRKSGRSTSSLPHRTEELGRSCFPGLHTSSGPTGAPILDAGRAEFHDPAWLFLYGAQQSCRDHLEFGRTMKRGRSIPR
jgi:hypothetical protein